MTEVTYSITGGIYGTAESTLDTTERANYTVPEDRNGCGWKGVNLCLGYLLYKRCYHGIKVQGF